MRGRGKNLVSRKFTQIEVADLHGLRNYVAGRDRPRPVSRKISKNSVKLSKLSVGQTRE